jgi:transcription initiation factor TFIID TATA-box-binding protein
MAPTKSGMDLNTVNVVATADTQQPINIIKLGEFNWGLYDEAIYGGRVAYVKNESMTGRVTVFPSGKLIGVGARSIRRAFHELRHVVELLVQEKLIKPCKIRPKVRNIVSCVQLPDSIDLENLSARIPSIYEPEQFPGLTYHPKNLEPVCVIFFSSGKCVIAGAKTMDEVHRTVKEILPLARGR